MLVAYVVVGVLIAYQLTHVDRHPVSRQASELGAPFEDLEFQTEDGLTLYGWRIMPTDKPLVSVVFVHGLLVNRASHHHFELARHFVASGIHSILFDLRGHGESEGKLVSGGFFEKRDVQAALRNSDPSSCRILFGSSLGGAAAIGAAEELGSAIDGLVVDSSFADIADVLAHEVHQSLSLPLPIARLFVPGATVAAKALYGISLSELALEEVVGALPYPILVIHGADDTRISADHARRLHARAAAGSELLIIPEADHTLAYVVDTSAYVTAVDHYVSTRCDT